MASDDTGTALENWASAHGFEHTEAALKGRTPLLRAGLADEIEDAQAGELGGHPAVIGELVIVSSGVFESLSVVGLEDTDAHSFTTLISDVDASGWGRLTIHPVNVPEEDFFTRIFDHQDHRVRHIDEEFDRRFRVRVARAVPDEQVRELFDADFVGWCLDQNDLLVEAEQSEESGGALLVARTDTDLTAAELDDLAARSAFLIDRLGL